MTVQQGACHKLAVAEIKKAMKKNKAMKTPVEILIETEVFICCGEDNNPIEVFTCMKTNFFTFAFPLFCFFSSTGSPSGKQRSA